MPRAGDVRRLAGRSPSARSRGTGSSLYIGYEYNRRTARYFWTRCTEQSKVV